MPYSDTPPLVSVLMLTYNHAPYLSQAIESVLGQQSDYPFELIICDDASTDGTQDIARRHAEKDPRIVLSLQPVNTRFGKNFVDACALVRGRYVAFCEGDDYWSSTEKLQKQVSFLEQHPDFSVCAHKVQMLVMDLNQPNSRQEFIYKDCTADEERIRDGIFYADEAIANYYFQTGSLVLRWRFTEGLPHWFRKRMMFDHFMFMLHAVEGKIKYFDEIMSVWRRHGGGYTWLQTRDKGLFFQKEGYDWIAMYRKMDNFFSKRFTWQLRERILLALRSIAANCIETGNTDQLYSLIKLYSNEFEWVLKNAILVDALRLACPEKPEFSPPWQSALQDEPKKAAAQNETLPQGHEDTKVASQKEGQFALASPLVFSSPVGGCFAWALDDIPQVRDSVWSGWTRGQEYARFFNLRSALFRWLWQQGVSTVWVPTYCPPIVDKNRLACQFTRKFYAVGNKLEADTAFLAEVRPGEAVLTIQYLGRPLSENLYTALSARKDILWVDDRAQSLAAGQDSLAHAVIYSPRKLFGVPDGGLLVGKGARELETWCVPSSPATLSERHGLLMQCYERPDSMDNSHNLRWAKHELEHQLSRKRMSHTTEALLRRLPLSDAVRRRQDNWEALYQRLGAYCLWNMARPDFAPYAFPLLSPPDYPAEILHTLLTRHKIFCQRMWYPLPITKNLFPLEEGLSKRLLLLSCDQRYRQEDMGRVADLVIRILKNPQWAVKTDASFSVAD